MFDAYVAVPADVECQDEAGRLWDIVWMLRCALQRAPEGVSRIAFCLYVRNDNRRARKVTLAAQCGALDFDDPRPAIKLEDADDIRPGHRTRMHRERALKRGEAALSACFAVMC